MNEYAFLCHLIDAGAGTCASCPDRKCLRIDDQYCERLQKAFRSIVEIKDAEEKK